MCRAGGPACDEPFLDGCRVGAVWGTHWHGSLESDGFRRASWRVAAAAGRRFVPAPDTDFAALREAQLDRLADLMDEHLDTAALLRLIEDGAPAGLPLPPPGGTMTTVLLLSTADTDLLAARAASAQAAPGAVPTASATRRGSTRTPICPRCWRAPTWRWCGFWAAGGPGSGGSRCSPGQACRPSCSAASRCRTPS